MNDPYLKTVTLEGFHFRKTGKGGSYRADLPFAIPSNASNGHWSREDMILSYTTPNPAAEDGTLVAPDLHSATITQEQIDAAKESLFGFDLERAKGLKRKMVKHDRDATWRADLTTSFGVPFKADIQTQVDLHFLIQSLAEDADIFEGFKCADGVRRDVTKAQFKTAISEGISRKIAAFADEAERLQAVDAAESQSEIDAA